MGYAFEPMRDKWNAFKAALLLGVIWALWHVPLYYFLIALCATIDETMANFRWNKDVNTVNNFSKKGEKR